MNKTPDERWSQQKVDLKVIFPQLHEDDFKYDYGMKEVMMTKLQKKLGRSREQLNAVLAQTL